MEWLIEIFGIFLDAICDGWFCFVQKNVSDKIKNQKFRIVSKVLAGLLSIAVLMLIIIGICFLTSNDKSDKTLGICFAGFGGLLIAISIVLVVKKRKNLK